MRKLAARIGGMNAENTAVSVDVKVKLTVRGQDFVLTLDELRALQSQIGAAIGQVKAPQVSRDDARKAVQEALDHWREDNQKARPFYPPQRPWEIPPHQQRGIGWPTSPPVTCVAVI